VTVLHNADGGHFVPLQQFSIPYPNLAQKLLVTDLNGDCIPDLVIIGQTYISPCSGSFRGGAAILYGDADGGFGPPSLYLFWDQEGTAPSEVATVGPVNQPRALAFGTDCGDALSVLGDASRQ
jgi:hypothetical protein